MSTIQIDLGGGASIALPAEKAVAALIQRLQDGTRAAQPRLTIGAYAAGLGGIFAGTLRGDDGNEYGLIVSEEQDVGKHAWGPSRELELSQWDGLANTDHLSDNDHRAAIEAAKYQKDGHTDFYLPSRRELTLALANVPHLFNPEGWYWSSTPVSDWGAWAVDFQRGTVFNGYRDDEFRVRPVRRFPL